LSPVHSSILLVSRSLSQKDNQTAYRAIQSINHDRWINGRSNVSPTTCQASKLLARQAWIDDGPGTEQTTSLASHGPSSVSSRPVVETVTGRPEPIYQSSKNLHSRGREAVYSLEPCLLPSVTSLPFPFIARRLNAVVIRSDRFRLRVYHLHNAEDDRVLERDRMFAQETRANEILCSLSKSMLTSRTREAFARLSVSLPSTPGQMCITTSPSVHFFPPVHQTDQPS